MAGTEGGDRGDPRAREELRLAASTPAAARRRGRGATANPTGRFEPARREAFADGWEPDEDLPPLRTEVMLERARTIITRNDSPDIGFDRSINPYRGCEHGCVYCFARPNHAYAGLSPGLDFETKLFAKPNAADLLARELSAKGYRPRVIALGTATDPYQPIERRHRITRAVLEVLDRFNHPVGIVTKSDLVLRDLDLLRAMAARGLVRVAVSVTTLDGDLARRMEPRAPRPGKRLAAIRALAAAGIPVAVLMAPLIPALNDHEIEAVLARAREAGATECAGVLLRLPHELADLVRDWFAAHYPGRAARSFALLGEARGGRAYDATFGRRFTGTGPYAELLAERVRRAARRLGYGEGRAPLRTDLFAVPAPEGGQYRLF
ncbi:Radical SAM domain protein [Methylobacterium sp. 4-46]|uniref:PA0069 family radical SAM protein n=1 Tax=unclassified Methylobacterium TaxID=2615210 RepID=UPI000152D45F|nr:MULTISPECIES: PA0069 family radical SAM protein [unclassified Methylobacterium]ACA19732.1 Radical SAM domain protein [Methylobacterium sp. 4-46]